MTLYLMVMSVLSENDDNVTIDKDDVIKEGKSQRPLNSVGMVSLLQETS